MRVAIYEPDPRICGPDTWARHLRGGFRDIGCDCDVVAFTRSGKPSSRWGRVKRDRGMGQACRLEPDATYRVEAAGAALDEYDLVVLTDVKCPTQDKPAYTKDELWPEYIDVLMGTSTPWVSALHGKWYFEESERPKGVNVARGSPYLADLLGLSNFAGYLIEHAELGSYCKYSEKLRATRREYLPLPYSLEVPDELALADSDERRATICALGRVTKIKYRHLLSELACRDQLPRGVRRVLYAGGSSCQQGPNESFELYEMHKDRGWACEREGGTKSAMPWTARRDDLAVEYYGMYFAAEEVGVHAHSHVGLTDSGFSGGLFEFSTLEAIDCGCLPIVSQAFVPPYAGDMVIEVVPHDLHGRHGVVRSTDGYQKFDLSPEAERDDEREAWLESLRERLVAARDRWSPDVAATNRRELRTYHDPRLHAAAFLKGAGLR